MSMAVTLYSPSLPPVASYGATFTLYQVFGVLLLEQDCLCCIFLISDFLSSYVIVKIYRRNWIQWKIQKVAGGEKYCVTRERAADETEEWAGGAAGTYGPHWKLQCYGHWGFALQVKWHSKLLCRLFFRQYHFADIQKLLCDVKYIITINTVNTSSHLTSPQLKIYRNIILPVVLYGCETWSLTLREERRLRVFENRVLRRIFGPKRDKVMGVEKTTKLGV